MNMRSVLNYFGVGLGSEITVPLTRRAAVPPIKASSLQVKVYTHNAASYLKFRAFHFFCAYVWFCLKEEAMCQGTYATYNTTYTGLVLPPTRMHLWT